MPSSSADVSHAPQPLSYPNWPAVASYGLLGRRKEGHSKIEKVKGSEEDEGY